MSSKITLIQPSLNLHKGNPEAPLFSAIPLGLASIASYTRQKTGAEISICDAYLKGYTQERIFEILKCEQPDLVGISDTTDMIYDAYEVARIVRRIVPEAFVIVGGAHASVRPEEIIKNENVDAVCVGEGEIVLSEVVELLEGRRSIESIKGIGFKQSNQIRFNPDSEFIGDLDSIPFPAYDLLGLSEYNYLHHWGGKGRTVSLVTTRGCCFNCEFCHIPQVQGKKIRFRSPDNIIDEIYFLRKQYGIKNLSFQDSTFLVSKSRTKKLCEMLMSSGMDVGWSCSSRVDTVPDNKTLEMMKKAGCKSIFLGVESGNEDILKRVKNVTRQETVNACRKIKRNGIGVHCSFIIGLMGETPDTARQTIEFAKVLNPDTVSFNVAIPYPGTILQERYKVNNHILHENWSDYSKRVVIDLGNGLGPAMLQKYRIQALQSFYLRPKYILRRFVNTRSLTELLNYIRVFWGLLLKRTKYF